MKYLIDFSFFYYECIHLYHKDELRFSYYTDLENHSLQNIIRLMINMFKEMCNNLDYFDKLNKKEHNFHSLEIQYRKNIAILYKNHEDEEWSNQNILECDFVYQRNIKDNKSRIFFILDKNNKIIKPLFLDLNHLIIPIKGYKNSFLNCFVCQRTLQNCQKKLKEPIKGSNN